MDKKYNSTLDIIKLIATILIVGSHCLPLFNNNIYNFYYGQFFFRFCVPLFFLTSGYFFIQMNKKDQKSYIKRILLLYVISTILYLPLQMYYNVPFKEMIHNIIFGYLHLWYLSALLFGLVIYYFINKYKKMNYLIIPLLLIGILFSTYYRLFDIKFLNSIYDLLYHLGTARNFLFFALPLIMIGGLIFKNKDKLLSIKNKIYILLIPLSILLSFLESTLLYNTLGYDIQLDLSIFNLIFPILLFIISFKIKINFKKINTKYIRKVCDYVYIVHLYIMCILSLELKVTHIKLFILVIIISFIISYLICLFLILINKLIEQDKKILTN